MVNRYLRSRRSGARLSGERNANSVNGLAKSVAHWYPLPACDRSDLNLRRARRWLDCIVRDREHKRPWGLRQPAWVIRASGVGAEQRKALCSCREDLLRSPMSASTFNRKLTYAFARFDCRVRTWPVHGCRLRAPATGTIAPVT